MHFRAFGRMSASDADKSERQADFRCVRAAALIGAARVRLVQRRQSSRSTRVDQRAPAVRPREPPARPPGDSVVVASREPRADQLRRLARRPALQSTAERAPLLSPLFISRREHSRWRRRNFRPTPHAIERAPQAESLLDANYLKAPETLH